VFDAHFTGDSQPRPRLGRTFVGQPAGMQPGRNRPSHGSSRRPWIWLLGVASLAVAAVGIAAIVGPPAMATAVVRPDSRPAPAALKAPRPAGPVRLVVLGDSVASGAGCTCKPFGQLLAAGLATESRRTVAVTNAARDGLTTHGLLDQLEGSDVARAVSGAALVTVTVGANDFDPDLADNTDCLGPSADACYRNRLSSFRSLLPRVLARIHVLSPTSHVLVTGYWNLFLDGDVGRQHGGTYVHVSDALTRTVNAEIAQQAEQAGATYVDLYAPFEHQSLSGLTALLAPDGDHPSQSGHQLISTVLLNAVAPTTGG
jgi:lysophospholipase L1-like esterase